MIRLAKPVIIPGSFVISLLGYLAATSELIGALLLHLHVHEKNRFLTYMPEDKGFILCLIALKLGRKAGFSDQQSFSSPVMYCG